MIDKNQENHVGTVVHVEAEVSQTEDNIVSKNYTGSIVAFSVLLVIFSNVSFCSLSIELEPVRFTDDDVIEEQAEGSEADSLVVLNNQTGNNTPTI